jgi:hypothetical protein
MPIMFGRVTFNGFRSRDTARASWDGDAAKVTSIEAVFDPKVASDDLTAWQVSMQAHRGDATFVGADGRHWKLCDASGVMTTLSGMHLLAKGPPVLTRDYEG